jgi:hypothetical protein
MTINLVPPHDLEDPDETVVRRLPEQKKVLRLGSNKGVAGYQPAMPLGEQWRTGVVPRVAVPAGAPRSLDDLPPAFRKPLAPPGRRAP